MENALAPQPVKVTATMPWKVAVDFHAMLEASKRLKRADDNGVEDPHAVTAVVDAGRELAATVEQFEPLGSPSCIKYVTDPAYEINTADTEKG